MDYIIWYRDALIENHRNEKEAMEKYFHCVDSRVKIEAGQNVIARYSALPYYEEQAYDIDCIGARLINSFKQHQWVADIRNWYEELKGFTPKTWPGLDWIDEDGPYVLKGMTNSRKQKWRTHMYAENRKVAADIYWELLTDPLFQDTKQDIVIRKFERLYTYFSGINGMPITKEFRFFVFKGKIISGGYYWSQYINDLPEEPNINEVPREFLDEVISRVGNNINFWLLDVGQKDDGDWIVIELGDAQCGGLSCNDPFILYKNLKQECDKVLA